MSRNVSCVVVVINPGHPGVRDLYPCVHMVRYSAALANMSKVHIFTRYIAV